VTLTPGGTPDGGTLSWSGGSTLPDAVARSLTLTVGSDGTVNFTYTAPAVAPGGSGTISFSSTGTTVPANIAVTD
jgi:hypothetical protein